MNIDVDALTNALVVGNKIMLTRDWKRVVKAEQRRATEALRPPEQNQAYKLVNLFLNAVLWLPRGERNEYFQYCFYCGDDLREVPRNMDHIYPVSLGGRKLVDSCVACNNWKRDMHLERFRISRFGEGHKFWAEGVIDRMARDKRGTTYRTPAKYLIENVVTGSDKCNEIS